MGKLSTFITRLKQTLTKIGEDVKDLRDNKADVSDLDDYLPRSGGTMNGNVDFTNNNYGISKNGGLRLTFTGYSTTISANNTGSNPAIFFNPQGYNNTEGRVTIRANGQIDTANHGDSSQWKQAYDWGNHAGLYLEKSTLAVSPASAWDTIGENRIVTSTSAANSPYSSYGLGLNLVSGSSGSGEAQLFFCNNPSFQNIQFRTRRLNDWSAVKTVWDNSNFNPAQYVLQSSLNTQLANYVTISGTQTIGGTKTFTNAPIVPNGTLNGHTVNLGQLNSAISNKANVDGSNTIGGSWNIDELGSTAIGSYSTVYALDNSVVGINPTNSLGVSPGILLMKQGFPIVIAENENPDWDGYLYRAGTPLDGYPGNQQNGNYLIESKHRFRLHTITAPDSTSGGVGSLQINPFNGIEHNYFRVTISSVDSLVIFIKEPYRDEITDSIIERNAIGQKCTVAVSGSLDKVKFANVDGANFSTEWNKGVFEFYWTGTGWIFGGYSPIEP